MLQGEPARLISVTRRTCQVASLCDGAVYYGELTHQRLLGVDQPDLGERQPDDGQLEEDFHQVGGCLVVQLCRD